MKKLFLIFLSLTLSFVLISCKKEVPKYGEKLNTTDENYLRAIDQSKIIYDTYWDEHAGLFYSFDVEPPVFDPLLSEGGAATLWGYGAALTMAGNILKIDPTYQPAIDIAYDIVENLEQFRYKGSDMIYYTAVVHMGGEAYYDDNAWVVLGLYEIAMALNDDNIMNTSKGIMDYVMSGESVHGGVYWKETTISRHTCSTGPAIVSALLFYELTKDTKYLDFAIRNYEFAVNVLRDDNGMYNDYALHNIETGEEFVDKAKYTYNTGTMIWAGALLFDITGVESYKEDALLSSEGGLLFATQRPNEDVAFYPATPWFNLYLLQGYISVGLILEEDKYVEHMRASLDYAWEHAKNDSGLVAKNWKLAVYDHNQILDVAATAECYALLAYYDIARS